ncbi:MAG: 3-isopropylmalate dehydratase small subunit [Opitutae bacterium]|nr:3-isopropylmalate dehydratase small subunit [Opitutae bacterium]MCD8298191.1 3-isopropylmalate dehydratase small subunit [Opitutae bacterium]
MALEKIKCIEATAVCVAGDDIDTDRIIPARFLKSITFDGLGEFAFYDERKNPDGTDKPHPLNAPEAKGAGVLVSGMNFGCGSSREHAPQALWRRGIRAIVAGSFAEIFFGNATTIGLACVCATRENLDALARWVEKNPREKVRVDLENLRVSFGGNNIEVSMPDSTRRALLDGRWDPIADLLENADKISALAAKLP